MAIFFVVKLAAIFIYGLIAGSCFQQSLLTPQQSAVHSDAIIYHSEVLSKLADYSIFIPQKDYIFVKNRFSEKCFRVPQEQQRTIKLCFETRLPDHKLLAYYGDKLGETIDMEEVVQQSYDTEKVLAIVENALFNPFLHTPEEIQYFLKERFCDGIPQCIITKVIPQP